MPARRLARAARPGLLAGAAGAQQADDGAAAGPGAQAQLHLQQAHQPGHDGQAQAHALFAPAPGGAKLHELLEDFAPARPRDAAAGVGHLDLGAAAAHAQLKADAALIGVAQRIRQQVAQHALQQHRVAAHPGLVGGAGLQLELQALGVGQGGLVPGHQRLQRHGLPVGLHQSGVELSGGVSVVYSDVLGTAGSQVILSGNSNTTFYGKLDVQSGAELRVSTGSVATFFDLVSQRTGSKFTGSGAKRFEGGLSVGASPGLGTDEGDVEFGEDNVYLAEIGGTTACTLACGSNDAFKNSSFDKYMVAGNLSLNGTLKLTSWNGFVAKPGQHFDLLDWGSLTGTFAAIDTQGLHLAAGSQLDFSLLYTTGEISVTAVPEPSTYALWLAGLSLLPWCARRQRRGQAFN